MLDEENQLPYKLPSYLGTYATYIHTHTLKIGSFLDLVLPLRELFKEMVRN